MSALKRKADPTTTITLRIPTPIKNEIDRLRPIADARGFDVNTSLVDAVVRCTKQIADELAALPQDTVTASSNGDVSALPALRQN